MKTITRPGDKPRDTLPLSVGLIPAGLFAGLSYLTESSWPGMEKTSGGYLFLSLTIAFPILVLCARPGTRTRRMLAVLVASIASLGLALHAGLAQHLVLDLDAYPWPGTGTLDGALGIVLSAMAIPAGLLLAERWNRDNIIVWSLIPALTGASGQLVWFGITRAINGPTGIEYWLGTRLLIHAGTGTVAGLLLGSIRMFGLPSNLEGASGPVDLLVRRLPRSLPLAAVLGLAILVSSSVKVVALASDDDRFVTDRIDGYFLALSNIRRARDANMEYPQLSTDMDKARLALLGAANFDPKLGPLLEEMLSTMESTNPSPDSSQTFKNAVLSLDRHMLDNDIPYFLEPHEIPEPGRKIRFLLRYRITTKNYVDTPGGNQLAMLRLRRLDELMVDTPYTGLSYPGIGTIMMDHIDDSALRVQGRLLADRALTVRKEEGKFAKARSWMRADKRRAMEEALARRGIDNRLALRKLANIGEAWRHRVDTHLAREHMDVETMAAFDALTESLARQTEVHEARHALDGELDLTVEPLAQLNPGPLAQSAAAETRAHLTEMVEGPMGPGFGLASIFGLLAGEHARANAYFFASVVILEGLWGDVVRKPAVVTEEGPDGPVEKTIPIGPSSPGWLSYSRITACYKDLRALPPEELQARSRALFEQLFNETYVPVSGEQ